MNGSNDETRSETKKKAHEKTGQYDHIQAELLVFFFIQWTNERQEPNTPSLNSTYHT